MPTVKAAESKLDLKLVREFVAEDNRKSANTGADGYLSPEVIKESIEYLEAVIPFATPGSPKIKEQRCLTALRNLLPAAERAKAGGQPGVAFMHPDFYKPEFSSAERRAMLLADVFFGDGDGLATCNEIARAAHNEAAKRLAQDPALALLEGLRPKVSPRYNYVDDFLFERAGFGDLLSQTGKLYDETMAREEQIRRELLTLGPEESVQFLFALQLDIGNLEWKSDELVYALFESPTEREADVLKAERLKLDNQRKRSEETLRKLEAQEDLRRRLDVRDPALLPRR